MAFVGLQRRRATQNVHRATRLRVGSTELRPFCTKRDAHASGASQIFASAPRRATQRGGGARRGPRHVQGVQRVLNQIHLARRAGLEWLFARNFWLRRKTGAARCGPGMTSSPTMPVMWFTVLTRELMGLRREILYNQSES